MQELGLAVEYRKDKDLRKKAKSLFPVALIPEFDLKLAVEALYATTTENDQLHSYLNYLEKPRMREYVRGIVRKDYDFKPAIWNQFCKI